jgi:hypothetical protein
MTLGSVQPGAEVWTVGKDATNPISIGAVCVPDTATTPDSYKIAPAADGQAGPFVVCVNKAAAATDTAFAAAFPGSFVTVKAQGAIEVAKPVYTSATVAGSVSATAGTNAVVGRYIGHENEITGKTPATAAADGETNIVIRLGGTA